MSLTFTGARDEVLTLFKTAWDAGAPTVPLRYWDKKSAIPGTSNDAWADIQMQWTGGEQRGFGLGTRRYNREGIVTVKIFTPFGDGLIQADSLTKIAADAFEGVDTPNGVWFRRVRVNHVGQRGEWYQTNVLADFFYDEVK
jgi:hypothetical protein